MVSIVNGFMVFYYIVGSRLRFYPEIKYICYELTDAIFTYLLIIPTTCSRKTHPLPPCLSSSLHMNNDESSAIRRPPLKRH